MDQRRHDPCRTVVEVYDHPQPARGIKIAPVELFAARPRIVRAVVRICHGPEDRVDVIEEVRSALGKVLLASRIENDQTAVGVADLRVVGQ